jgi:membrane dipeptidase
MMKGSTSNRHLPDEVVDGVIARGGVIGIVPYNKFLQAHWSDVDGKNAVTLNDVAAHIDYICQRAGDALHVGLGTDSDGGFGRESIPAELDNIADMQKLVSLLSERGYQPADIEGVMGGNWLGQLRQVLPEK